MLLGVEVMRELGNRQKHREAIPAAAALTGGDVEEVGSGGNFVRRAPKLSYLRALKPPCRQIHRPPISPLSTHLSHRSYHGTIAERRRDPGAGGRSMRA